MLYIYIYIKRARERNSLSQVLFSTAHALQDLNRVLMVIYICDNSDEVRFSSHNLTPAKNTSAKRKQTKLNGKVVR